VKTVMIALSAAALIAAVPVVSAQSSTPGQHHKLSKKHPPNVWHETKAGNSNKGSKKGYPGALGYAPGEPRDQATEMSRQAGGGGGGGSGM
jgi:hypothetical protein